MLGPLTRCVGTIMGITAYYLSLGKVRVQVEASASRGRSISRSSGSWEMMRDVLEHEGCWLQD